MMFLNPRIYGLLILIVSVLVRAAYDLSIELVLRGDLQVRLDYNLARPAGAPPTQTSKKDIRTVVFTSHLEFGQDVKTLVELGRYGFTKYAKPSVMTVFAIGKEIFLASSQKGLTSFINTFPDSPVVKSLALCQATFSDPTEYYMHEAKCGEIMSAHSFFRKHPAATTMNGLGGRTVSVEMAGGTGSLQIKAPCGTGRDDKWGCNLFVEKQGLREVPVGTTAAPYQLNGSRDDIRVVAEHTWEMLRNWS
ncbi:uncharacterized protein PAC_09818 [Phialocephala subalpina]|uniref:Uncharacterized protein n=1 Tax=Phialocephala subalpina TaxID=576137 RepID=A0A1L7X4H4_9HELO|nr:uncharacterized protein PAC_09818 [Phialocephala subalpina]